MIRPHPLRALSALSITSLFLSIALFSTPTDAMVSTAQFQSWYPQYGFIFATALRDNCTAQYERYLTGDQAGNQDNIDKYGGGGTISVLTQPVVLCILDNTSEYVKSLMSSAQVLLGLMPTMLSLLGISTEELAMLNNVGRRPFLSFLIALGSPSVYLSRAFSYTHPRELLASHEHRLWQTPPTRGIGTTAVTMLEYTVAILAVANVALLDYDLGTKTICSWMSDMTLAPFIWNIMALAIYIVGYISFRMRARREYYAVKLEDSATGFHGDEGKVEAETVKIDSLRKWFADTPRRLHEIASLEFTPCVNQNRMRITLWPERKWYIVLSWILSAGTVIHIVFGTIMFSALNFIGPKDSMGVVGRYMLSVFVCRIIVVYELSGLRDRYLEGKLGEKETVGILAQGGTLVKQNSMDSLIVNEPRTVFVSGDGVVQQRAAVQAASHGIYEV